MMKFIIRFQLSLGGLFIGIMITVGILHKYYLLSIIYGLFFVGVLGMLWIIRSFNRLTEDLDSLYKDDKTVSENMDKIFEVLKQL
jgi:cytochrome c biogenesis protein CcdA